MTATRSRSCWAPHTVGTSPNRGRPRAVTLVATAKVTPPSAAPTTTRLAVPRRTPRPAHRRRPTRDAPMRQTSACTPARPEIHRILIHPSPPTNSPARDPRTPCSRQSTISRSPSRGRKRLPVGLDDLRRDVMQPYSPALRDRNRRVRPLWKASTYDQQRFPGPSADQPPPPDQPRPDPATHHLLDHGQ